jgi:hypothetical protein
VRKRIFRRRRGPSKVFAGLIVGGGAVFAVLLVACA